MVAKFWQTLFSRNEDAPATSDTEATGPQWLSRNAFPHLHTDKDKAEQFKVGADALTQEISSSELNEHMKKLANEKAAGPDSMTGECLKLLQDDAKFALNEVLNEVMRTQRVPTAW